ncbi:MAG: N-carbamoyl-L-amino acid amidohydrolase [Mariprofundaceae bacterium]
MMFIQIDIKTLHEKIISSENMAEILEADMKPKLVDEALTDMVCGTYEHRNATTVYKYRSS